METRTKKKQSKWPSCRLVVQQPTGRVQWCVGQECTWKTKLKRLAFLPIILLAIILLCVFFTHHYKAPFNTINTTTATTTTHQETSDLSLIEVSDHYEDFETFKGENHEVIEDIKTSYIPSERTIKRSKRLARLDYESFNSTNYEDYNSSQDYFGAESKLIIWRVPIEDDLDSDSDEFNNKHDKLLDIEASAEKLSKEEMEHQNFWKNKHTSEEIRRTQAFNMKKYMDTRADPCDDFYQYACGNWHKYNPIPPDRSSFDTFEMLRESLDSVLRDLLEENVPSDPVVFDREYWSNLKPLQRDKRHVYDFYKIADNKQVPKPFYQVILNHSYPQATDALIKAKFLFKSCMNEEMIKIRGIKPLLYLIKELGGWPILDEAWDESKFDFESLLGQLRLYNNDIIISEWVGPDIRNSEEYVIQLDQSTLGLPSRDYFIDKANKKFVDAYKHFIETVAVLLGADPTSAYDEAAEMVEFETALASITVSAERRKNVSDIYVRLQIRELQSIVPQIDWFKYVSIITNREAQPDDPIVTFSLNYLHKLVGLLSVTKPRTTANYLLWRFIRHRVNNLDDRFQDAKQRFYKVLFGREQSPARWQSCISQVNSNLGMALGNLFVRKYFDERSKNDTLQMTIQLRQSFKELLMETEWLDIDTKKAAALKIDYMRLKIGYPNYILSDHLLNKRYQDVQVHPDFYFENTLSILQHLTRLEHSKLTIAVDKSFWNSPPAVVNAYYSRNKNQIMFPAGILQPPFYHRHFPRSLNYGGIGVVIGHEMTHGFDDKGRLFDKDGNLKVWWKKESIEEFHERSKCIIEQYNAYVVPEANMPMDGANTQGENIADNGGIKQAFRAYTHWLRRNAVNSEHETLPGLKLNNMQLFFLNFAQIWCGSTRPEAARNKLRTAVHSPGRFRVIGTLSNSDEFSKVYHCPAGAPMNPKVKCKIW